VWQIAPVPAGDDRNNLGPVDTDRFPQIAFVVREVALNGTMMANLNTTTSSNLSRSPRCLANNWLHHRKQAQLLFNKRAE
jgi:hypothetical protein